MIIWFNCKISDIRPNPQPRYTLRDDNRLDIAKYTFASYYPLYSVTSKIIFNLEMADGLAGKEAEMEEWLRSVFPEKMLSIHWHRCNNISQWKEVQEEINQIDDNVIFPAGNEDHVFMDSNIELFKVGLKLLNEPDRPVNTTFMTSHWPESIRAAHHFGGKEKNGFIEYAIGNNDAIRVMNKDLFNWYIDQIKDPNKMIFRTEHWNDIVLPENVMLIPTKEQCRHFDGYGHVGIGPEYCPPLEIPPGFFEKNMIIRYGFNERYPDCVNINPMADKLYTEDPENGTDYKMTLDDIPMFWKSYIKEIIVAPNIDEQALKEARDTNLLVSSRLHFNWPHFGVEFNEKNYPPVKWLNPHMQALEFAD